MKSERPAGVEPSEAFKNDLVRRSPLEQAYTTRSTTQVQSRCGCVDGTGQTGPWPDAATAAFWRHKFVLFRERTGVGGEPHSCAPQPQRSSFCWLRLLMDVRADKARVRAAIRESLVAHMRYRDRLAFPAVRTIAKDAGVTTRTVQRHLKEMHANGEIIERSPVLPSGRTVTTRVWSLPDGTRRLPRTPEMSPRKRLRPDYRSVRGHRFPQASLEEQPHYVRLARTRRTWHRRQQWRLIVGDVIPISAEPPATPPLEKPATTGQALFAAIVDVFDAEGVRLPRGIVAIAAKQGASAIHDGVDPETALAGCVLAVRQGKARYTIHVIADVALARSGMYVTSHEARSMIVNERQRNNAPLQKLLDVWRQERDAENITKIGRGTL